jgi:hypothetical protein
MGEGAAIGWMLFALGLVLTVIILVSLRRRKDGEASGVEVA